MRTQLRYITGMIVLSAILFVSCAPGGVMTKQDDRHTFEAQDNKQTDSFVFSDTNSAIRPAGQQDSHFFQVGIASWYGREFQGRPTASGQPFDMNKHTAAHRTLPFGSVIMVTNLDNGKKIQVTVNDRGPFKNNRILDLSHRAARDLDMLTKGEARVGITVISHGSDSNQNTPSGNIGVFGEPIGPEAETDVVPQTQSQGLGGTALQTGAFYSKINADRLKARIEGLVDKPVVVVQEGFFYKVQITNISDSEVQHYTNILRRNDVPSFRVDLHK